MNQSVFISSRVLYSCALVPARSRYPCQLVGDGHSQNIRVQALSGANEPDSKAVLGPVGRTRMTRAA